MRGKAFSKANGNANLGITPAYAGKRGFGLFPQPLYLGSPPPMRGKV